MNQNPIIFLDHDGVMCLTSNYGTRFNKAKKYAEEHSIPIANFYSIPNLPTHVLFDDFDPKAVKVLNRILSITNADIVVSSDWRLEGTLEQLKEVYAQNGVTKSPIDFTPHIKTVTGTNSNIRVKEIQHWLNMNPTNKWVAIDDMDLSKLECFVRTPRENEGIKQSGVIDKIIKLIN